MDVAHYAREMLRYYNHRVDPKVDPPGEARAAEYDRNFERKGHYLWELGREVQRVFEGRAVLEVAAGGGQYSRYLARAARSLVSTDMADCALERLEACVTAGEGLEAGRFKAMRLDAFRPDEAPGMFTGGVAINWFQHVPAEYQDEWIRRFHRKLSPGSRALIAINHLRPTSRARLFSKTGDPNLYEQRQAYDGECFDIIDNVFSEHDLRKIFGPHAEKIEFTCGVGYYWIAYGPRGWPRRETGPKMKKGQSAGPHPLHRSTV